MNGHAQDRPACLKGANSGSDSGFRINPSAWADKPPDQKPVPGIKQNTESPAKLKSRPVNPPAAEVATAVRALAIMLDFRRRNDGPVAVTADFAGNPITVFNLNSAGEQSSLLQHGTVRLSGIIQVE